MSVFFVCFFFRHLTQIPASRKCLADKSGRTTQPQRKKTTIGRTAVRETGMVEVQLTNIRTLSMEFMGISVGLNRASIMPREFIFIFLFFSRCYFFQRLHSLPLQEKD